MSDLLTHAEYQALAADLDLPRSPFIDGKYQRGNGEPLSTVNPATGAEITTITTADAGQIDLAVSKAREAFDQGHWSKMHPSDRKDVLIRLCKLITRNRRALAVMESVESGKPILDCETVDVPETIHTIKWHAEAIDKIYDQTTAMELPADDAGVEDRSGLGGWLFDHRETGGTDQHDSAARGRTGA